MYWYMLFLGHLVIGLIIGFILYEFFHDRTMIFFCALGSVLPDIVDKPLGHIIFSSSLDNGKIFFHSLVIVLLFFITGLIVWKYYRSFSFLVVGFGMFLHQLVDMMWTRPVNWYYPLLGPYQAEVSPDYFQQAILAELSSVTEWIFFAAILVVALVLYRNQTLHNTLLDPDPRMQQKTTRKFYSGLVAVALFVLVIAIIIITIWDPFFNY
jgi:membrane-bound metal-dependent hydrolase YbcI (DUF457 family)